MKNFILIIIVLSISLPIIAYSQEETFGENETGEEILAREQFILMRRAGGPGKILPQDAYSNAIKQKNNLPYDKNILSSPTRLTNWISINPSGMFYNVTGNNYISGRTNSIAFHPTDPNTFYIGAAQGGVWKTTNGGLNWIALTDNLSTLACGDVVVVQSNPNILYLGTGELNYSYDSQYGNGIFKSTDAGATWVQVASPTLVGTKCSQLAIDPFNANIVYAATNLGVFKSSDAGMNWAYTESGTEAICIILNSLNSQIIYITTGGSSAGLIKKSTDGGNNWTTLSSGLPEDMGRIQLAIARNNQSIIYASISYPSGGKLLGLYRSTDGGNNWTSQTTTPNYLGEQGWYDNSIVVKPNDPNTVIVGGIDIYSSSTGGTSLEQKSDWATTNTDMFAHADIHCLKYNGSVLYCCSDGGVYKSTNDGNDWTDLNRTISTLQYQSADYDPTNLLLFQGGTQDNNKQYTTDGGYQWIQRNTGDGGYTIIDPVNTNYVYGQYVRGSIQRSTNKGISFTNITPSGSSGGLFYNPYEIAPGDHNTIVFGRSDVWKTTNAQTATSSSGWTQIATTTTIGENVSAIGISATNTNIIYIGTSSGKLLSTTDNGDNWTTITGFPYISDLIVDNTNDAICYASLTGATGKHILKTTNYGVNWTDITGDIPNIAVNSILLRTASPRMIIAGTDIGIFKSTNEGLNWINFGNGLPAVQIYDMKYKQSIGIILVATHGRGCWTFDLNSSIGIDPFGQIPEKFNLSQNFPNPFNPVTNIEFDIPKYSSVTLKIFDISGRTIDKLVNNNLNAGHYSVQWNATKYSSGAYFYRLEADDYKDVKRMMLVK
jgi:photosystem II stability/assembly factor-like uncharacterized protein